MVTGREVSPELTESVYAQLRAIAQHQLNQERAGHTLQATALVHEAFVRMNKGAAREAGVAAEAAGGGRGILGDRAFLWAAAEAMRRILIEHARARGALKRGGGRAREDWTRAIENVASLAQDAEPEEIESLDGAILRLEKEDPRAAGVVRLRFFAGLSIEEVASVMELSSRTVKRDWEYARAWLARHL